MSNVIWGNWISKDVIPYDNIEYGTLSQRQLRPGFWRKIFDSSFYIPEEDFYGTPWHEEVPDGKNVIAVRFPANSSAYKMNKKSKKN